MFVVLTVREPLRPKAGVGFTKFLLFVGVFLEKHFESKLFEDQGCWCCCLLFVVGCLLFVVFQEISNRTH